MSVPTRILISGATGRMGRTVARLAAADPDFIVVGGLDREGASDPPEEVPEVATPANPGSLLGSADVVIDFSAPAFLRQVLTTRSESGDTTGLVVGTTGLSSEDRILLERASESAPVLTAANFSVGVNLLLMLAEQAAASLGQRFDVEIVETHHRRKEDAPSGTALALGEAVASGRSVDLDEVRRDGRSGRPGPRPDGEIGFHSLRGGDVIGEHHVHFIGELERIDLTHRAEDRAVFAAGALRAARWLAAQKPGFYSMRDVLGL
ncbi:MAG: 4-hydroxy-tetrahydrodipicolinate reductase [Gemmatimonas sp.]|nr:4-hydroxy-tetrahydrodipicolinate reductase [Gemmatimonas sp.]